MTTQVTLRRCARPPNNTNCAPSLPVNADPPLDLQVRRAPSNNTNCGHECHYVQVTYFHLPAFPSATLLSRHELVTAMEHPHGAWSPLSDRYTSSAFYVQRPSEHPFIKRLVPTIADQKAASEALSLGPGLPRAVETILDANAWSFGWLSPHEAPSYEPSL